MSMVYDPNWLNQVMSNQSNATIVACNCTGACHRGPSFRCSSLPPAHTLSPSKPYGKKKSA